MWSGLPPIAGSPSTPTGPAQQLLGHPQSIFSVIYLWALCRGQLPGEPRTGPVIWEDCGCSWSPGAACGPELGHSDSQQGGAWPLRWDRAAVDPSPHPQWVPKARVPSSPSLASWLPRPLPYQCFSVPRCWDHHELGWRTVGTQQEKGSCLPALWPK